MGICLCRIVHNLRVHTRLGADIGSSASDRAVWRTFYHLFCLTSSSSHFKRRQGHDILFGYPRENRGQQPTFMGGARPLLWHDRDPLNRQLSSSLAHGQLPKARRTNSCFKYIPDRAN